VNQLPYYIKLQISYLKDSKYLPELTQLNQNALKVVLSNHNFENYIKEN
jgi:3-dehydroquinate dehydratase